MLSARAHKTISLITIGVMFLSLTHSELNPESPNQQQQQQQQQQKGCGKDHFRVNSTTCHPFLTCEDQQDIITQHELGVGYVKKIFLSQWKGIPVVYSTPRYEHTQEDFLHGIKMLTAFQTSSHVAQLIGSCTLPQSPFLVTKFYQHGSADNLDELITRLELSASAELDLRLKLAEDYISILEFLHSSPVGVRVMCDSNDLKKTMSQFVITDELRLALLDVDALPEVHQGNSNGTIKCGHKELYGDFVAPEQLWPYPDVEFDDSRMPGYDEKTDIWKVPDVLQYLLGTSNAAYRLKLHLFETFRRCKEEEPKWRPDAKYIRDVFGRAVVHERRIKLEL